MYCLQNDLFHSKGSDLFHSKGNFNLCQPTIDRNLTDLVVQKSIYTLTDFLHLISTVGCNLQL